MWNDSSNKNKWSLEASEGWSRPGVDVRWSKWTLINNKVYLGLFFSPLLRSRTTFHVFLCVVAWLQPSSEYGIFLSQLLCILRPFLGWFYARTLFAGRCPANPWQHVANTAAHCLILFVLQQGFCSRMGFAYHCLLVESLVNNYTPAVLISDMDISAGCAVISDNGGHFLRLSQLELMMNQAHYGGHMWLCADSDDALSLWLIQTFINYPFQIIDSWKWMTTFSFPVWSRKMGPFK